MINTTKNRGVFNNIIYLIKNIWQYDKGLFLIFVSYIFVVSVLPFVDIFGPKLLIDEITTLKRPKSVFFILIIYFFMTATLSYLLSNLEVLSSSRILRVRFQFMKKLQRKTMTMEFKHTENPEILNNVETAWRAANSNNIGIEGMMNKVLFIIGSLISFMGYAAILMKLNLLVLIYLILNLTIVYLFTIKVKKYEHSQKDTISTSDRKSKYIYDVMYNFSYGKEIRIYNLSSWFIDKFNMYKADKLNIEKSIIGKYFKVSLLDILLCIVREGIVYGYLIYRVIYKAMTIGEFSMYFVTIGAFSLWMKSILDSIASIRLQNMYINDFRDFMEFGDQPSMESQKPIVKNETYEVEFRNVWFKYPNTERYIFKNISLKIKWGQRIAIVGGNGEGKTTFVKLLTRLYEPTEGKILINGIDTSTIDKEEYFKIFSVVFQDVNLFAFSVAENITLTDSDKSDRGKVIEALKKVKLNSKIENLERGIDTSVLRVIDERGVEFSGGERQKLALARALYKDSPIIVLDEPTAALDPIAEYEIYKAFDEIIGEKVGVYISHRLASTKFCDVIVLFNNGTIEECGTHEELIKLDGRYAEMFNTQAAYYRENMEVSMDA